MSRKKGVRENAVRDADAAASRKSKRRSRNFVILGFALALTGQFASLAYGETFILPLDQTNGWQFLSYRKIPPNTFRASSAGLEIRVQKSAGPAVFPLPHQIHVTEVRARGTITGLLKVPPKKQGDRGFDDYAIRIGLVEAGSRTLSWREKLVSAEWVKKLFALAPSGTGIRRVHFFNVGTDPGQIGQTRTHPLSDLIEETVVVVPDADGRFAFTKRFAQPINVLAVWIASDGDDTKSSLSVTVSKVELETRPDRSR